MPRKQKNKPQKSTLDNRYHFNPYFYKKKDIQNDNDQKYASFIRKLRLEFRNLRKENSELKNRLARLTNTPAENKNQSETSDKTLVEEIKTQCETIVSPKPENELHKKATNELTKKNEHLNTDEYVEYLVNENNALKLENVRLNDQIEIYSKAIEKYRDEIAMKISGQVKSDFDPCF
jgi:uncharacterized protein YlxW (UPF0749 family)